MPSYAHHQRGSLGPSRRCPACLERYEHYQCARCGPDVCILKTIGHTDICSTCDLRERFAEIPETERLAIQAAAEQGEGSGVFPAHGILGWSLSDVISLVRMVRSERGVWGNG